MYRIMCGSPYPCLFLQHLAKEVAEVCGTLKTPQQVGRGRTQSLPTEFGTPATLSMHIHMSFAAACMHGW